MRKVALPLAVIAFAMQFLAAPPAEAGAPRTWVSGTGDDMNFNFNCSRTAPCKTFAGAILSTAPGGEINCLDPGDFGSVFITFSLTISCEAGTAGILVPPSGSGIFVNAPATDVVTLRGLDIDGQGNGVDGIGILSAKAVHIEKCSIRNVRHGNGGGAGIVTFAEAGSTVFLFVTDTVISDNGVAVELASSGGYKVASLKNVTITGSLSDGLYLASTNGYANVSDSIISGNGGSAFILLAASTVVNIDHSTIANNGTGLHAGNGSTIRVSGNNIYNNTTGIVIGNGGTVQSDGTNKHGNSNGGAQVPNGAFAQY